METAELRRRLNELQASSTSSKEDALQLAKDAIDELEKHFADIDSSIFDGPSDFQGFGGGINVPYRIDG